MSTKKKSPPLTPDPTPPDHPTTGLPDYIALAAARADESPEQLQQYKIDYSGQIIVIITSDYRKLTFSFRQLAGKLHSGEFL